MERAKKDVYLEWLLGGVLFASEWAGIQIAIFTPNIPLPISVFLLWILVQGAVSFFLVAQAWNALRRRKNERGGY